MKKYKLIALLLAVATLGSCGSKASGEKDAVATEVVVDSTPVEVTSLGLEDIQNELAYGGKAITTSSVNVNGKLSGEVLSVNYEVGDRVSAGDVLYQIDSTSIQNNIKTLESQLKTSELSITSAKTGLDTVQGGQYQSSLLQLETTIESTKNQLENGQIAINNAQNALDIQTTSYNNAKILLDSGTMSKSDFDKIELSYNQAVSALEQAKIAYNSTETALKQQEETYELTKGKISQENTDKAKIGVSQAVAGKESVQVQLQIARESLADATVKSPISGTVSYVGVKKGEMTSPQATAFTIVNLNDVEIEVSVSEAIINKIRTGDSAIVNIATVNTGDVWATVTQVNSASVQTGLYPVKLKLTQQVVDVKPGMFAEVRFVIEKSENALVVPREVVLNDGEQNYVFVADDDIAVKKIVTTGIDNGKKIEILSGVAKGAPIITKGHQYLSDGEHIRIVKNN